MASDDHVEETCMQDVQGRLWPSRLLPPHHPQPHLTSRPCRSQVHAPLGRLASARLQSLPFDGDRYLDLQFHDAPR